MPHDKRLGIGQGLIGDPKEKRRSGEKWRPPLAEIKGATAPPGGAAVSDTLMTKARDGAS